MWTTIALGLVGFLAGIGLFVVARGLWVRAADIYQRATAVPDAAAVVASLSPEELVSMVSVEQLSALADAAYDSKRRTAR